MPRKLLVLGTCHTLQCGCAPYSFADIERYRIHVRDTCRSEGVRFVAEEMSAAALAEKSVAATVASSLGTEASLDLETAYVDIDRPLRGKLGIDDYGSRAAAILPEQRSPDEKLGERFREHISNPLRECSWLAQIISKNKWPTLLICGAEHVQGVAERARVIGIDVGVTDEDYEP